MKKLTWVVVVMMVFVLAVSASAIDQKGKFSLGGYGGYAFGFGDEFKKFELLGSSWQHKATFCFGAKVKYGITPNVALAGAVDYQGFKYEVKGPLSELENSENWHYMALLINAVYVFSPEATTSPYVTAGGGYYIPSVEGADSKPGINAGIGVEHFFKPNLALDAGFRFHMIMTEDQSTTYVQGLVGLNYYFGTE